MRVVQTRTWPSPVALATWVVFGAAIGLLLMIFQPPLGFLLAVLLPAWALIAAVRGRVQERDYKVGAFGVGILLTFVVLLVPLVLG
jgi:hypothetical protein